MKNSRLGDKYAMKKTNINFTHVFAASLLLMGFGVWFVSSPIRAGFLDRYILYHVDDVIRYSLMRRAFYDWRVLLNPYLKAGYSVIQFAGLSILADSMAALRIVNALFSAGIILLVYKLSLRIGITEKGALFAAVVMFTFPVYFLVSLSTLAEVLFAFTVVAAVYLLYMKKFLLSTLAASMIPLFRQEGIFLLVLWIVVLVRNRKALYIFLLPIPFTIWSALNVYQLGHGFLYSFYPGHPWGHAPENSTTTFRQFMYIAGVLSVHPLVVFAPCGALIKRRDSKFRYVISVFLIYMFVLLSANILHFAVHGVFSREIRFLFPLLPFAAIMAASVFEYIFKKKSPKTNRALVILILILPLMTGFQIIKLQNDPVIHEETLTRRQEIVFSRSMNWLNIYIQSNNISTAFIPAELFTDKIIRRVWKNIPGNISWLLLLGFLEGQRSPERVSVLDISTFRFKYVEDRLGPQSLFITINDKNGTNSVFQYELLNEFPEIGLRFYAVESHESKNH